tara:strand:+ start:647 stop:1504 length:858 start_codon:yes stop_codon:yes gene_type:complete
MIIWISSYPKSGNTYIRSFLAAYYYSNNGKFQFDDLLKMEQFPNLKYSKFKTKSMEETSKNWIYNQKSFFDKEKLNFVKTHNTLVEYKGNKFTTKNETLAAIYIVRDPRNLITSFVNHYSLTYEQAINFMIDENSSLIEKTADGDHSSFTYINTWSNHYKSWKNNKEFKTLFIKYEDLENKKEETFLTIINFLNNVNNNSEKIDDKKFKNSIKSTNFVNLKNKEKTEGFYESVVSKKTGKKINFFNLGFNNRWEKILDRNTINKMNDIFKSDLEQLGYENFNKKQ